MDAAALPASVFRSLVHFAPDGFLVVDESGGIVFANAQVESLFGYTRDELVGAAIETLIPERLRSGHGEHRADYWRDPAARAMGSRLSLVARRRDRRELPVEVSLAPIYTDDGMFVAVTVRDVSERRGMEEALRRSEEQHRLLSEHAHDVVYRLALTPSPARLEYVSPSVLALTGRAPSEFYAEPELMVRVTHPDDRPLLEDLIERPDEARSPLLLRAVRPDGTVVWHEQRFALVRDEADAVIAIEGIIRDVTEHRGLEEERRLLMAATEIEQERERIAADLHDGVMQTIYSVGLQLSSFLRHASWLPDGNRDEIREAIGELETAIGDIRRYVMDLRPADFMGDLRGSLDDLARLFQATSGVQAVFDAEADLPDLEDEQSFEIFLLVREALSNVRRHAGASTVRLEAHSQDGTLEVRVVDNGVGFDSGAGRPDAHFGLRNMATRARLVGGELEVASEPGHGTTVSLRLRRSATPTDGLARQSGQDHLRGRVTPA